jgi:hypothetical protein
MSYEDEDFDEEDLRNLYNYLEYINLPIVCDLLSDDQEEDIFDTWCNNYDYPIAIEREKRVFFIPPFGCILCHITPLDENNNNAYYTIWKNEDFRFFNDPDISQYTVTYYDKFDEDVTLEVYDEIDTVESDTICNVNNLLSAVESIVEHWEDEKDDYI